MNQFQKQLDHLRKQGKRLRLSEISSTALRYSALQSEISPINRETIFSTNNENDIIYPRSSIKIFQGIPFFSSNAVKLYNLNRKQIALSCSSHCGEDFHVKELKNWLEFIELKN